MFIKHLTAYQDDNHLPMLIQRPTHVHMDMRYSSLPPRCCKYSLRIAHILHFLQSYRIRHHIVCFLWDGIGDTKARIKRDEDEDRLRNMPPICTKVLIKWDLDVNESKTGFVRLFLASPGEVDDSGALLKNNKPWRSSKSLETSR